MSKIVDLFTRRPAHSPADGDIAAFLQGFSIEVMPRTAAKIESFAEILPVGTRIYLAHIEGTPIEDMVSTARRIANEGFPVSPVIAFFWARAAAEYGALPSAVFDGWAQASLKLSSFRM